jgi:hypothetical protein
MATNPIQPGDPVTADIINSLVLDIAELNKTKAGSFSLSLASAGGDQNKNNVSQKIYSTQKSFKSKVKGAPTQIKWDLTSFKLANPPKVWHQLVSNGSYDGSEFKFMIQVLSVTNTQAIFEVRGIGFTDDTFNIYLFAVE